MNKGANSAFDFFPKKTTVQKIPRATRNYFSKNLLLVVTITAWLLLPMISHSWIVVHPPRLLGHYGRSIGPKKGQPARSFFFSSSSSSSSRMASTTTTTSARRTGTKVNGEKTSTTKPFIENSKTIQIPCPCTETNDGDYHLPHLQERAQWLIDHHSSVVQGKVCLAIAGGGGHALSTLAATAGASQLLLQGTILYDRTSFQTYVHKALPMERKSGFSYSSVEAAEMASTSALLRGMQLVAHTNNEANNNINSSLSALAHVIGVGSASTLKTTTQGGMSRTGRPSHGNIVATRSTMTLSNHYQVGMKLILNCPTQNRFQQDVFVSHMIYQTLEELGPKKSNNISVESKQISNESRAMVDPEEFIGVTIQQWSRNCMNTTNCLEEMDPVQSAANRILSGDAPAVLLLPKQSDDDNHNTAPPSAPKSSTSCDFLEPLMFPVLPENCLIFPGSFNPPHAGHVELAKAAIANISTQQRPRPIVFEISIVNADKPAMEPPEVARRVAQFRDILFGQDDAHTIPQWGILLTSAPLFADKVRVLKPYAPPPLPPDDRFPILDDNDFDNDIDSINGENGRRATAKHNISNRWSFVIGTDTMVRILNPKYYDHDPDQMLQALRSMGADFVVGGRVEQTSSSSEFVTGQESLEGLPPDIQDMFVLLEESDFRVDISSTELRAAYQRQQQQERQQEQDR